MQYGHQFRSDRFEEKLPGKKDFLRRLTWLKNTHFTSPAAYVKLYMLAKFYSLICTFATVNAKATNIHPIFEKALGRKEKEAFLKQRSKVIWLTGLSGSGKSTIALGLEKKMLANGYFSELLDGDNVRSGINNNLGFSEADRLENNRRIAEISKLFVDCGIICINCFVSPTLQIRKMACEIIGRENYLEIFINTPLEECEKRDVKGLYKKARAGEIRDFTGIHQPFETPVNHDLEIKTVGRSVEECVNQLYEFILPKIKF